MGHEMCPLLWNCFGTYNIPPFKYLAICVHGKQRNACNGWVVCYCYAVLVKVEHKILIKLKYQMA
jgi:hypothetical protein